MKRIFSLSLAALMLVATLVGCTTNGGGKELTVEERTALYKTAIEGARDQQTNDDLPLMVTGEDIPDVIFDVLGVPKADMSAFAMYVSAMNVQAYGVAAIYPAADKSDAVMEALQGFIDRQKQNFDMYLMEQFEIASNAKLEKLEDGTILLVMCDGQDDIFTSIKTAIEAGK